MNRHSSKMLAVQCFSCTMEAMAAYAVRFYSLSVKGMVRHKGQRDTIDGSAPEALSCGNAIAGVTTLSGVSPKALNKAQQKKG